MVIQLVSAATSAIVILALVYHDRAFEDFRRSPFKARAVGLVDRVNRVYSALLLNHAAAVATVAAAWLVRHFLPAAVAGFAFYLTATFLFLRCLLFVRYNHRPFAAVWDDRSREAIREILGQVDRFFRERGITYVCSHGAVLGCLRTGGLVPWDGDIDIAVDRKTWRSLGELAPSLRALRLGLDLEHNANMAIISSLDRPVIYSPVEMRGFGHSWPHLEIYEMEEPAPDRLHIDDTTVPRDCVLPPRRARLEGVEVNLPCEPERFVKLIYGEDCLHRFVPDPYCNRYRFGYSWPKFVTSTPHVSTAQFGLWVVFGLIADCFTLHKGLYLLKLAILAAVLYPGS